MMITKEALIHTIEEVQSSLQMLKLNSDKKYIKLGTDIDFECLRITLDYIICHKQFNIGISFNKIRYVIMELTEPDKFGNRAYGICVENDHITDLEKHINGIYERHFYDIEGEKKEIK
jgi:hypothetical protein